jgi:hypothetical protein
MRHIFFSKLLLLSVVSMSSAWASCAQAQRQGAGSNPAPVQAQRRDSGDQREALPADLKCPADYHPTLWEGKVVEFAPAKDQTKIAVHSDWDADYSGVISHPGKGEPPLSLFRLKGEPFEESDREFIYSDTNKVKPDVRAKVWVCTDKAGKNPIIQQVDWLGVNTKRSKATP